MEKGHTPEPWETYRFTEYGETCFYIKEAYRDLTDEQRNSEGCELHLRARDDANNALIKAAPEMLAALERMRSVFSPFPREDTEGWREEHEACEWADMAIAQARGEVKL